MDPTLNSVKGRLTTFTHWPVSSKPSAESLARCGFIFTGNTDFVKCVACGVLLGQWQPNEDPNKRHSLLNAKCLFVTSQISAVSNYSDNQRQDSILVPGWLGVRAQHSDIPVAVAEASFSTMSIVEIPTTSRFHSPESGVAEENVNNDDHLRGERNRLMTFRQWPTSANARPEALAEAGFYYMEVGDIVRCVFCRGSLKNWEVSDDPRTEHKKFYPGCPFLLHENVGNVPLRNIEPLLKMNEGVSDSNKQIPILSLPSFNDYTLSEDIREFDQITDRRLSYDHRILPAGQTADGLAEAGFYHTGRGDMVKCFYCEGALDSWNRLDDPWTEHARWYPACSFLRRMKGVEFIQEVLHRFSTRPRESSEIHQQSRQQPSGTNKVKRTGIGSISGGEGGERGGGGGGDRWTSEGERMQTEDSIRPPITDAMLCKICMEEPMDTVFQPCNHVACCQHCTPGLTLCPICRGPILSTMKIYLT